jgi:hypothetical protein
MEVSGEFLLGNSTKDERTLIVNIEGDLVVGPEGLVIPQVRKRGMSLNIKGDLILEGKISMTARGANAPGQDIFLTEYNGVTYDIPAYGGTGGGSITVTRSSGGCCQPGNPGEDAPVSGATGGGGGGRACCNWSGTRTSGSGSQGTSFSGGAGGGGVHGYNYTLSAENASPDGGKGGDGYSGPRHNSAGGGAGNLGGLGMTEGSLNSTYDGEDGTGGLLIIAVSGRIDIKSTGIIEANGMMGGGGSGGGSSGGGSVNIFYTEELINNGTIEALGGYSNSAGGKGGDGSVAIVKIE